MVESREVQNRLKNALAMMNENTIKELMKRDKSYCESASLREKEERKYWKIKDSFSAEQLEVIEKFLDAIELNNADVNDLYYLAGVKDAIKILDAYGMLK